MEREHKEEEGESSKRAINISTTMKERITVRPKPTTAAESVNSSSSSTTTTIIDKRYGSKFKKEWLFNSSCFTFLRECKPNLTKALCVVLDNSDAQSLCDECDDDDIQDFDSDDNERNAKCHAKQKENHPVRAGHLWTYLLDGESVPNFKKLVQFIFSIPASNAFCETIFSHMKYLWNDSRNRMNHDFVGPGLKIKTNTHFTCTQFYDYLLNEPDLLKQI
ncbi:unnamed protein product [Rotaria socialis]|uniref:HAT C-terminal dimerisation domain-containing protein n=1 Tax=Rotaria socialis TaxID=392032 RepID=A0A817PW93_9BILA|nr:unnamed protein product [Rotaria socialis]CAF4453069.1 unnamed protein product [Rotaria socialis]